MSPTVPFWLDSTLHDIRKVFLVRSLIRFVEGVRNSWGSAVEDVEIVIICKEVEYLDSSAQINLDPSVKSIHKKKPDIKHLVEDTDTCSVDHNNSFIDPFFGYIRWYFLLATFFGLVPLCSGGSSIMVNQTDPEIKFGDPVALLCTTTENSNEPVKRLEWRKDNTPIAFGNFSYNQMKYSVSTSRVNATYHYILIINDIATTDINCQYICKMDFEEAVFDFSSNRSGLILHIEEDKGKWKSQATVFKCFGDRILTKFKYDDPMVIYEALLSITWFYKEDESNEAVIICQYDSVHGFKISPNSTYSQRVKWIEGTYNIVIENISANDTGLYDISINIFNNGDIGTFNTSGTLGLIVDDPCIQNKLMAGGCTEMSCLSTDSNPVYTWTGDGADEKTTAVVEVCPTQNTNYTCCVDIGKTKCTTFSIESADHSAVRIPFKWVTFGIAISIATCIVLIVILIACCIHFKRQRDNQRCQYSHMNGRNVDKDTGV